MTESLFLRHVGVEIGLCGRLSIVCLALQRLVELHWILGPRIYVCVNRAPGRATKLARKAFSQNSQTGSRWLATTMDYSRAC
jgi:hypothetical protein